MLNFFNKNEIKGFKVCRISDRTKKFGIAADSLKSLTAKIEEKFKIKNFELFYENALIDEGFFKTIPGQSVIIVVEEGEEYKTEIDIVFSTFHKIYEQSFNARDILKKFIKNNQNEDLIKTILKVQNDIEEKTKFSSKESHPEWFSDFKKSTKEEVMKTKAKDRIKGYFYKTTDELKKSRIYQTNADGRRLIDELLTDFFVLLSGVDFFECLFDRSHDEKYLVPRISDETDAKPFVKRRRVDEDTKLKIKQSNIFEKYLVSLCDEIGLFTCHGAWNSKNCSYEHKINPYASRESLILFQIFNLDHQVEISRSIFPSIIKNVEQLCTKKESKCEEHGKKLTNLSTISYFLEIFTVKNLKLVHIVCHDKGSHDLKTHGRLLCDDCKETKMIKKIKLKIS